MGALNGGTEWGTKLDAGRGAAARGEPCPQNALDSLNRGTECGGTESGHRPWAAAPVVAEAAVRRPERVVVAPVLAGVPPLPPVAPTLFSPRGHKYIDCPPQNGPNLLGRRRRPQSSDPTVHAPNINHQTWTASAKTLGVGAGGDPEWGYPVGVDTRSSLTWH